ncbi:MAG TPA: hypothetical protein IAB87_09235 [Candidatus Coprenecus merdipullorum]|nr:hypothetical protein [Candidatus Coprenecus merdipullorum]
MRRIVIKAAIVLVAFAAMTGCSRSVLEFSGPRELSCNAQSVEYRAVGSVSAFELYQVSYELLSADGPSTSIVEDGFAEYQRDGGYYLSEWFSVVQAGETIMLSVTENPTPYIRKIKIGYSTDSPRWEGDVLEIRQVPRQ